MNQTHKTDELTGYFKMPIFFQVFFKDGSSSTKKAWLSHASDTVYVSAPNDSPVEYTLFDPESNVLKTLEFQRNFEELSAQALNAKNMIDRYDALAALKETGLDQKRDLLIRLFNKETFNVIKNEVISQLAKDDNAASISLFNRALHDKDLTVRRAVVDNLETFPNAIVADVENLLTDSSYVTIENTLRKLYKLYPEKAKVYLDKTKGVMGHNNNVRITWLEIAAKEAKAGTTEQDQLVEYTSNRYEFLTRVKAMGAAERLVFCNDALVRNLFNAALSSNTRLGGPAIRTLKVLIAKPENLKLAKGIFEMGTWKDWESKALTEALKP
ncbi:MAG: hypothetical protein IPP77_13815 [Bacteroidetes bacterium]|nr:hypothetical protein [Bacteroidota bacterium]